MEMLDQNKQLRSNYVCPSTKAVDDDVLEPSCRNTAAHALTIVRDGVITGEGPTTKGRIHFSRALDADDAAWCARILTAAAVEHQPVSRAEVEALFEINDAAAERSDDGRFDDLPGQGGRPSRRGRVRPAGAAAHGGAVAGHRYRELGAGAGHQGQHRGAAVDRRPDARQAPQQPHADGDGRERRRRRRVPLAQLPNVFDIGMM